MKFIDEIILNACSGAGGNGVVRWAHLHDKPRGGPAGGDGGKGGDVYIRGVRDIAKLSKYRGSNTFTAGRGVDGGGSSLHGKNGEDITIDLPIGSIIKITSTGESIELISEGERFLILSGGSGGYGNEHFKGSRNVAPKEQTNGMSGECSDIYVELRIIADVGLIGFPNTGKSSLLNVLTKAHAKVGNYQFTTLDPNLGDMNGYIIADIPGIIEGASKGKGLGDKFLRHIMRTKILLHCISVDQNSLKNRYSAVRDELGSHSSYLRDKFEVIVLTKTDLITDVELSKLRVEAQKLSDIVFTVSIFDDASVKRLKDGLSKILQKNNSLI